MKSRMEDQSRKLQLLRAGSREFAIFADEISAIVQWREPAPLPDAPKSVLGVVSVQGRMLTVLDLAVLSNNENGAGNIPTHIIGLKGDEQLALAVSELREIVDVSDSALEGPVSSEGKLVLKVLRHEGRDVRVLDPRELFATALQGRERRRRRF